MLDEKTILTTAKLAKLQLSQDEIREYEEKFNEIFTLFTSIKKEEISALEPLGHPLMLDQPMREDCSEGSSVDHDNISVNSKAFSQGYFKVPKVIE